MGAEAVGPVAVDVLVCVDVDLGDVYLIIYVISSSLQSIDVSMNVLSVNNIIGCHGAREARRSRPQYECGQHANTNTN